MVALHPLSPTLNINPQAITGSTIVEECDELYQKFSNVRPSCKKHGCGEHRTSHPHKNPNKKRKRPRVRQPRDAKRRKLNPYDLDLVAVTISVQSWVFVRSSERKSIVTNSKFYLQFNMTYTGDHAGRGCHPGSWSERDQRRVDERYDSLLGQYSEQQVSWFTDYDDLLMKTFIARRARKFWGITVSYSRFIINILQYNKWFAHWRPRPPRSMLQ